MRRAIDPSVRAAAVRLRTEGRLSVNEIQAQLPERVARSTLSRWLRRYPLSSCERREREWKNADRLNAALRSGRDTGGWGTSLHGAAL